MNVLDLEEFEVLEGYDSEEYYKFVVEAKEPPVFCTLCGSFIEEGQQFKVHDKRPRSVADVDLRGKKVVIDIIQKRYKCPNCGDNFTEYFKSIARNDRVTQRLFKRMGEDSIKGKNFGRLTRDPELKYTPNGIAVASITLAVNRPFSNQQGNREADFINVIIWRKQAENVANYLRKGSLAGVEGRLQTRSYENNDGKKVFLVEVIAGHVAFLDKKKE